MLYIGLVILLTFLLGIPVGLVKKPVTTPNTLFVLNSKYPHDHLDIYMRLKLETETPTNVVRQELITYEKIDGILVKKVTNRVFYDNSFVDSCSTLVLE